MIRKWPAEHGREIHPKPNFLVMAKTYLFVGPNISDFFYLCIYSGVRSPCVYPLCTFTVNVPRPASVVY